MSKNLRERFYRAIRDVPDFPEKGIVFKDITPLLLDPKLLDGADKEMAREMAGSTAKAKDMLARLK